MPTGYTSDIYNGKEIDFKTFALRCARAFGACVRQRDDDMNELPQIIEPNIAYHVEQLDRVKNKVKPTKQEFKQYVKDKIKEYKEDIDRNIKLGKRYEKMLNKVKKWTPPTPDHEGLKTFMIEQIESSIKFDSSTDYYRDNLTQIKNLTYENYCNQVLEEAKRSIIYHTEGIRKEKENVERANKWITDLYNSL